MSKSKNKGLIQSLRSKRVGFTLLEVMLAVTILSVGLVLVLRSYVTSLRAIKTTQKFLVANLLLEEKIWERQEQQTQAKGLVIDELEQEGEFETPFDNFSYRIGFTKQDLAPEYKGSLYKSTFTVSWQQREKEQSTSCVTYFRSKD